MTAHRPFMLVGRDHPQRCLPANDATGDESECVEDMAPVAALVALAATWLFEHRVAIAVGIWIGCLITTGLAALLEPFL